MPLTDKSFASGHFDVVIDGQRVTGYVLSVDGGLLKATSTEEAMCATHLRNRHLATRDIDPLTLELGASGSRWALEMLDQFLSQREDVRHGGSIRHADLNLKAQYEYTFRRALVTEITFPPKLDVRSKDFATIKVKMQPEEIDFSLKSRPEFSPTTTDRQKQWPASAFRLNIDGLDTSHVSTVEALTFKIGAMAFKAGGFKLPSYMPTELEMPTLSFAMPMKFAGEVIEWYRSAIDEERGTASPGLEHAKHGSIEILDASHTETVYEIELFNLSPKQFSIVTSDAKKAKTTLCKFEAHITTVKPVKSTTGMI